MTADYRCHCGHLLSDHDYTDEWSGTGCQAKRCDCTASRIREPGTGDPMTALSEAAASTREIFDSYLAAGFSRAEALHLTTAVTVAGINAAVAQ